MAKDLAKRESILQSLLGQPFESIPFSGQAAVVILVPNDVHEPPQAVRDRHASRKPWRFYPVEGAHLVKWPYLGGEVPKGCTIEPEGWDHEHCDGCNGHINAEQLFWQTIDEPCTWLCEDCYRRLQQLEV
jgi:hypothetical protein